MNALSGIRKVRLAWPRRIGGGTHYAYTGETVRGVDGRILARMVEVVGERKDTACGNAQEER